MMLRIRAKYWAIYVERLRFHALLLLTTVVYTINVKKNKKVKLDLSPITHTYKKANIIDVLL